MEEIAIYYKGRQIAVSSDIQGARAYIVELCEDEPTRSPYDFKTEERIAETAKVI